MGAGFEDMAAVATDTRFTVFGRAAAYTPPGGGDAVSCLVERRAPDSELAFGSGRPVLMGERLEVRVSEIPQPARGGVFAVANGPTLTVLADPEALDEFRLIWTMTVESNQ